MSGWIKINRSTLILCRTGMLCAVALMLSVFENMLPEFPFILPGMKLGLSNVAVMFSLEFCPLISSLAIVVVKASFALITRGMTAFLMSLSGGVLSVLGMYFVFRCKRILFGCFGIGITGAFLHNLGQLLVAYFLVADAVYAYFPLLSVAAILTGALTGLLMYIVIPPLKKVALFSKG